MIEKLEQTEYLVRDEIYSCLESLFEECKQVKVFRTLQDYSGNYDEIFNEYAALNLKKVEQMLADYFLDNVLIDDNKKIEHLYFVNEPVSTYLKFEALRVFVLNQLWQKTYATKNSGQMDFVVFDSSAVVLLDFTKEGALKGGFLSTKPSDVKFVLDEYEKLKTGAVDYLKMVPAESTTKNAINRKIKELKYNLKLK